MDRHYAMKLLREAEQSPRLLTTRQKFWKVDLFPLYLRRCDDVLFRNPPEGLLLTRPAPELAAKVAAANPGASGPDLMLLGHTYLGSAFRRNDDYRCAEECFAKARPYKDGASPKALAEHLRRYAYVLMHQGQPECFSVISEAIEIHKRGTLVYRHQLGECLLCRGRAYFEFRQPGKSLEDLTAALSHISVQIDPKPYYCALHNLAVWAVTYGSDEEVAVALDNLRPALALLNSQHRRHYAKYKMRWLIALMDTRLGQYDQAESTLIEIETGMESLGLPIEVGMVQLDLAMLYFLRGVPEEIGALIEKCTATFERLGVPAKVEEALDLWRQAEQYTPELLLSIRDVFAEYADPIPDRVAM